jgi:hypothetical protein
MKVTRRLLAGRPHRLSRLLAAEPLRLRRSLISTKMMCRSKNQYA